MLPFLFWLLLLAPATAFFLYPWLLQAVAAGRKPLPDVGEQELPSVTVIVSAYNEVEVIRERLTNLLQMDYPRERIQILVASDGSTDGTDEAVLEFAGEGVELLASLRNRGKSHALRSAVARANHSILVVTDANTRFEADAVRQLVRWFANPQIGIVCGKLIYVDENLSASATEEMRYWRWDNSLKELEGRLGWMIGGNGSILAIRKPLAVELPANVANDMAWCNHARIMGSKVGYEPKAIAWETSAGSTLAEYRRRVRIITRGWNGLALATRGLIQRQTNANPLPWSEATIFFGQLLAKKAARYLAFPCLLLAMSMLPVLPFGPAMVACAGLWGGLLMAILVGILQPAGRTIWPRWPNPIYPLALAVSSVVALARFLTGHGISRWKPERAVALPAHLSHELARVHRS